MNTFIKLLERKIEGCDAIGGLEREKAVYQSVLKDYKKQLTLTDVVKSFYCNDEEHYPNIEKCKQECDMCKKERLKQ